VVVCLQLGHRKRASLFFFQWEPVGGLCHRDGTECEVEVVFEFGLVGALAVGQACKLFGVSEKELDLETQCVAFQGPFPVFFGVGAEVEFVALYRAIGLEVFYRHKFDDALEALDPARAGLCPLAPASSPPATALKHHVLARRLRLERRIRRLCLHFCANESLRLETEQTLTCEGKRIRIKKIGADAASF
jgi:hypothetical protein